MVADLGARWEYCRRFPLLWWVVFVDHHGVNRHRGSSVVHIVVQCELFRIDSVSSLWITSRVDYGCARAFRFPFRMGFTIDSETCSATMSTIPYYLIEVVVEYDHGWATPVQIVLVLDARTRCSCSCSLCSREDWFSRNYSSTALERFFQGDGHHCYLTVLGNDNKDDLFKICNFSLAVVTTILT